LKIKADSFAKQDLAIFSAEVYKGKPYYGFYCDRACEYGRKCKQNMQDQAHRKMRNINKELIRQEYNDYINKDDKSPYN